MPGSGVAGIALDDKAVIGYNGQTSARSSKKSGAAAVAMTSGCDALVSRWVFEEEPVMAAI